MRTLRPLGFKGGTHRNAEPGGSGCLARRPHKMSRRLYLWDSGRAPRTTCTPVTLRASGLPPPRGVRGKETRPPHPARASGSPEGGAGPTACSAHCPAHSWPPAPLSAGRRAGPPRLPSGPRVTELMSAPCWVRGWEQPPIPVHPPARPCTNGSSRAPAHRLPRKSPGFPAGTPAWDCLETTLRSPKWQDPREVPQGVWQ